MKFTIAIPAFKAKFLKENIKSILNQTYSDFELIIVNDASPEDLNSIVSTFNDHRIRYYENKINCGAVNVVDNWNICLSYAKGEFFILMGDDDKMMPNYLEEFSVLIEKYPQLDIFHCRSNIIDENSQIIDVTPSWPEYESVYENIWHRMKMYRNQYISDFVYRTTTLKNKGGFYKLPLAWASDDISSFIAMGDKGIAHTQKIIFNYRFSPFTITNTGNTEFKIKAIIGERDWYKNFVKNSEPKNDLDKVLNRKILEYLNLYIKKKKIYTIAQSMHESELVVFIKYFLKRKKYFISISELCYAFILSVKNVLTK